MKTPALTGGDDLLKESGLGTSYIILLNEHSCTQAQGPGGPLSADSCELGLLTPILFIRCQGNTDHYWCHWRPRLSVLSTGFPLLYTGSASKLYTSILEFGETHLMDKLFNKHESYIKLFLI